MAQIAAPSTDSVDGNWLDQANGSSLAAAIDEASYSDSDYIKSETNPAHSGCRVKLATLSDPGSHQNHQISWRPGKDTTGGDAINMTVEIRQGGGDSLGAGTLIASRTRLDVDAFATYTETLLGSEAALISDYSDLYMEFYADVSLSTAILAISSLKAYWKCDDGSGTNVNDYGAGGHDGTTAGVLQAAGLANQPGKALVGNFTATHHADFNVSAAWSFVQCIRLQGLESAGGPFNLKFSGYPAPNLGGAVSGDSVLPNIKVWGGNTVCTATSGIADIDRWHLLIRTWNGTTAKIYLDGTDVSGSTTAPSPAYADGTEDLVFGGVGAAHAHAALYGKALSAGEVSSLTTAFNTEKAALPLATLDIGIHQDLNYNGTPGVRQNAITRLRAIHATYSRNTILWNLIEPTEGNFSWTRHDDVMNELEARGMNMHAVIASSPTWVNGGADIWQVPGTGVDATFNTWLSAYTTFVTTFATRYLGRIHRYELWNEPNLLGFWSNGSDAVDPAQYRAWYNAVRSAILAVDAAAEISFAGLANWSATGAGNQTGETFFRNCMAAGAMTIDNFAYHPYVGSDSDPDTFLTTYQNTFYGDIRQARDVLLEFGHDCPIWLTEFGWASSGGSHTETTQRDRLQNALEGIRDRLRDIASEAIIFIDYDQAPFVYGLYSDMPSDGSAPTAKLAAAMYSTFAADFDN